MPEASTFLVFAAASLAFLVVPGPAVVFVTRSIEQGRAAGVVSAIGVQAGGLLHVAAAVLGLSALLASSAMAFSVVKYAGAAYLVYLGIQRWRPPVRRSCSWPSCRSSPTPIAERSHLRSPPWASCS